MASPPAGPLAAVPTWRRVGEERGGLACAVRGGRPGDVIRGPGNTLHGDRMMLSGAREIFSIVVLPVAIISGGQEIYFIAIISEAQDIFCRYLQVLFEGDRDFVDSTIIENTTL